jgi:diadenosine tetraphosphatase ApaH/serine/threonine PP2A family protein phosphatase
MLDLFQLFAGGEAANKYLFLGDYVDRGYSSIETFVYLAYLKVKMPDRYYLLRGNHESRSVNQMYGLMNDCQAIYGNSGLWYALNNTFDLLPLAAVIDRRIFCVHGGLSPKIRYIEQILTFERERDIEQGGEGDTLESQGMSDLVWSDPEAVDQFRLNRRGLGQVFGEPQTRAFLRMNGLGENGFIARSHQLAPMGHKWLHHDQVVIVWSAPNYCYKADNLACVMHVPSDGGNEEKGVSFKEFDKDPKSDNKPPEKQFQSSYFA